VRRQFEGNAMTLRGLSALLITSTAIVCSGFAANAADPEAIVNGMFALSGNHAKVRASGAKGVCLSGSFNPTAEASSLSKAPQFAAQSTVTARFSMGGGNPGISDKTKPVTRGFAMRLADPAGDLVFVFISAPIFGARTPEQMLSGIEARRPGADGKQDAEKVKAFVAANPEVTRQSAWLNARPVPASFATTPYWGVHTFTLTNAAGAATAAKLKFVPVAGEVGLSDEDVKGKADSFYADELKSRLGQAPVRFDLMAVMPEPGDPLDDATVTWPEERRRSQKLGTLTITAPAANDACDQATFDPVVDLPDGIAGPADDPIFAIRSPAYAISLSRRGQ
jgi:catalase